MKISKLVDKIDIAINNGQLKKRFSSICKNNNEDKNLELNLNNSFAFKIILINKITSKSNIDFNNNVKQLCDSCIENKHQKIVKNKKMTLTTYRP